MSQHVISPIYIALHRIPKILLAGLYTGVGGEVIDNIAPLYGFFNQPHVLYVLLNYFYIAQASQIIRLACREVVQYRSL